MTPAGRPAMVGASGWRRQVFRAELGMADNGVPEVLGRRHQMFAMLTDAEIARIGRFGTVQRYERGARLVAMGEPGPGMFVVLAGALTLSQRDGMGRVVPVVSLGRGQFSGEVAQLSGGFSLVDGYAEDDLEALLVPPPQLRA